MVVKAEPKMPAAVASSDHYQPAERRIANAADLQKFLRSAALKDFMGFVLALNEAAQGRPISAETHPSAAVNSVAEVLSTLDTWVDQIPPAKQALRYGNPSYRDWFARLSSSADQLLQTILPSSMSEAAVELEPILCDSFGNKTRIDYGTGHETTFCVLLYCLAKLGVFSEQDKLTLVTHVFSKYLRLMRKIQTTYW